MSFITSPAFISEQLVEPEACGDDPQANYQNNISLLEQTKKLIN
jgi:hypothetical protein